MEKTEIMVDELQELKPIHFNYEQIKKELEIQLKRYDGLIFEEQDIQEAKKTRADLNRLKKQVNDKKIVIKKEFLKPYTDFENKIKEIIQMIDKPCMAIDSQIKAFEEKQKNLKKEEIIKIYKNNVKELKETLSIQRIWQDKWLNTTYKMKDIELEIVGIIDRVKTDLSVIENLKSEFEVQLKDKYITTLDLTPVIQEKVRLENIKKNEEVRNKEQEVLEKEENLFDSILKHSKRNISISMELTEKQVEELKEWLVKNKISYESEDF